jgi:hypothetical protein
VEKVEGLMVEWHQPDKTPEDIQDILRTNRVDKDTADEDFASYIRRYTKQNDEILNNIGSDYDENGIPYWLKYKEEQIEGRDNV